MMQKKLLQFISDYYLYFVLFISFISTAGSLYFSEVEHLVPCDLCWYQRIFMYAAFVISLTGAIIQDGKDTYKYLIGLAIPGMLIAAYNYYIQLFPQNQFIGGCQLDNPCTKVQWQEFGFVTIPLLSFVAFLVIAILCFIKLKLDHMQARSKSSI